MRYVFSDQKTYYSPVGVDKILDEVYFPEQTTGNCIEVGAVDGIDGSNTLYFERLGWNCLCIEPQPGIGYFESLKSNRKLALNYAISQKEQTDAIFTVVYCTPDWAGGKEYPWSGMSGLVPDERLIVDHEKLGLKPVKKEIFVETKRLDWCIDNHFKHDTIDFISIDVEGSELDVLQSFDVNKYNTKLLVIENNFNDPDVENYLRPLGWKKDMRVEINDFYIKA
jgi:FkbM family methyltransferase